MKRFYTDRLVKRLFGGYDHCVCGEGDCPFHIAYCACGCEEPVNYRRNGTPNIWVRGHERRAKRWTDERRQSFSAKKKGCRGIWKGKTLPESARENMRKARVGMTLSPEHRHNIGLSITGRKFSEATLDKLRAHRHTPETIAKMKGRTGSRCPAWKGGISSINNALRNSTEARQWKREVFRRDNFTCQDCGAKSSRGHKVHIQAHHLQSWSEFPALRFEVSNGLTLCHLCHGIRHGRKLRP
jgi:hypothetical protein